MVDKVATGHSRIPLSTRYMAVNGDVVSQTSSLPRSKIPERQVSKQRQSPLTNTRKASLDSKRKPNSCNNGSGMQQKTALSDSSLLDRKESGFETFLMTGDMIIRTTPAKLLKKTSDSCVCSESLQSDDDDFVRLSGKIPVLRAKSDGATNGDSLTEHISPFLINADKHVREVNSEIEECEKSSNGQISNGISPDETDLNEISSTTQHEIEMEFNSHGLLNGDPRTDLDSAPCISGDELSSNIESSDSSPLSDPATGDYVNLMKDLIRRSDENLNLSGSHSLVRSCKSHENYLQESSLDPNLVDIQLDEHSSSVDQIARNVQSSSSLDNVETNENPPLATNNLETNETAKPHLHNDASDRIFMPGFIKLDMPPPDDVSDSEIIGTKVPGKDGDTAQSSPEKSDLSADEFNDSFMNHSSSLHFEEYNMSELDRIFYQPLKEVDRPAASRLAKRLYNLDGFRKIDVSRHLCKKNDFNYLVAEEYLKYFEFAGLNLVSALRLFLEHFSLIGETQERERVLSHFTKRYTSNNPGIFQSQDACHTLTCAIMLLNTDLHTQNVVRKMTCGEFIENLSGLNDDGDFSHEMLEETYRNIRDEHIEWALDEDQSDGGSEGGDKKNDRDATKKTIGHNPFLSVPDPSTTTEYKKGYMMRKCCLNPNGRKTPFGKRGWKMFYVSLRDMILYLFKDELAYKKEGAAANCTNAIRIHHALVTKADDYTKKHHIFRLQTADWAEYLFQTSDSAELQVWIDTINVVAASLSAPPLPEPIGSQRKFQKPLMPSSYTNLNLQQQMQSHEKHVQELEAKIQEHYKSIPEKGAKSRVLIEYVEKENCLLFELKRFKSYCVILSAKVSTHPELDAVAIEAGEMNTAVKPTNQDKIAKALQRSLNDRYSYHAAVYKTEHTEYDMV